MEGKAVAVANVDGKFYAINNTCLHRGGPLGRGRSRESRDVSVARLAIRRHERQSGAEPGGGSRLLCRRGAWTRYLRGCGSLKAAVAKADNRIIFLHMYR